MSAQSNLAWAMPYSALPEEVRGEIRAAVDKGEDIKLLPEIPRQVYVDIVDECRQKGLLRVRKVPSQYGYGLSLQVLMEPEYDETYDEAWVGVEITSRYSPTLADDDESGGCWPIVFDKRMAAIQAIVEARLRPYLPKWWDGVWIAKEKWY